MGTTCAIRDAHVHISNLRTFKTYGALEAVAYGPSGRPGNTLGTGYLPDRWRAKLRDSVVVYVVYSYATPIGWVTIDGERVVPDVTYSVTTSKHQGQARMGLGVSWPNLTTTQRRAYSDLQLHGLLWSDSKISYARRTLQALVDAGLARWVDKRDDVAAHIEEVSP